jgi:arylsulfatase A-like enzyme
VQRAIEPEPGRFSMADLARAEIAHETRPVIAANPRVVLRWREEVELLEELRVAVELPAELRNRGLVRLDAWVSVPEASAREQTLRERRVAEFSRREILRATPTVIDSEMKQGQTVEDSTRAMLTIVVPAALRGMSGLLQVVARPLTSSAVKRWETHRFEIPSRARLFFGYGVEEPGWAEGWPPVHFRLSAQDDAGSPAVMLFERRIDPAGDARDRHWFDASVDLMSLVGRTVQFVFEAEALGDAPGASIDRSFPVVSNPELVVSPVGGIPTAGDRTRPNIVLISLDTLRAKSVGAYGYPRETTPTLDRRLAAEGALARFVVVPRPFTPPSHMSMLTGLEPCVHGVMSRHDVVGPERIMLAEVLRASGYKTAAFTENAYVVAGAGFARGFDRYVEERSEESAAPGFATETFRAAERWLAETDGRPFFLFIHTYQVHAPYRPPRGYRTLFRDDRLENAYPEQHRDNLTEYDREIRYTDDLLAGFLDSLETKGIAEQTIVAVTSDHGEGFGEHVWGGHGFSLHDEAVLVPLVVRAPGRVPPGLVIEEQVGLIDLMPTLLELAGLSVPVELQGRSFAPQLLGGGTPFAERPLFSAMSIGSTQAVRTRSYKYMRAQTPEVKEMLYDLERDPNELKDVAASDPEAVARARVLLSEHEEACEAFLAAHPAEPGAEIRAENNPGWLITRDEIDRKLRSLGYVE